MSDDESKAKVEAAAAEGSDAAADAPPPAADGDAEAPAEEGKGGEEAPAEGGGEAAGEGEGKGDDGDGTGDAGGGDGDGDAAAAAISAEAPKAAPAAIGGGHGSDLPEDFYYTRGALKKDLALGELTRDLAALHHSFGYEFRKRNNLQYLAPGVLLLSVGNTVQLYNTGTKKTQTIFGKDGRGVGALCVHPTRKFFAVGEKGESPNIYVYEYPSLKVYRVLRKGAEQSFAALDFSPDGSQLASVGGFPDFLLTVWNWKAESIILHTKAFSQEVFNVKFSPYLPGYLTTSGQSHIRFWRMAATFTGLKLQGDIGKFGKVELTDVEDFAELPAGRVVSGAENGSLLLWDGNFIMLEVRRADDSMPHEGNIMCVRLDKEKNQLVTGGADGRVCWWDVAKINVFEIDGDDPYIRIDPIAEVKVTRDRPGAAVTAMVPGPGHWVCADGSGALWHLDEETRERASPPLVQGHAGVVRAVDTSPKDHFAATIGEDGFVRCWDYVDQSQLFAQRFPSAGCSLDWAPLTVDASGRTVAAGFSNGVVRVLLRAKDEWKLLHVFKPHTKEVRAMQFAPDGSHLATGGEDGLLFLLAIDDVDGTPDGHDFKPVGFVDLGSQINSLSWNKRCDALLVAVEGGDVCEVSMPKERPDTTHSFELALPVTRYAFKPPKEAKAPKTAASRVRDGAGVAGGTPRSSQGGGTPRSNAGGGGGEAAASEGKAGGGTDGSVDGSQGTGAGGGDGGGEEKKDELEDPFAAAEEVGPGAALTAVYVPSAEDEAEAAGGGKEGDGDATAGAHSANFFMTCAAQGGNAIHECEWTNELGPTRSLASSDRPTRWLRLSNSRRFLISAGDDGAVFLRPARFPRQFVRVEIHDGSGNGGASGAGGARCAVLSHDDKFLLSVGGEGAFFVFRVRDLELEAAAEKADASTEPWVYTNAPTAVKAMPPMPDPSMMAAGGLQEPEAEAADAALFPITVEEVTGGDESAPPPVIPAAAGGDEAAEKAAAEARVAALGGKAAFEPVRSSVATDEHDEAKEADIQEPEDIADDAAYSIQDAKLKREEDNRRAAAEIKKDKVREQIATLREDFAALRAKIEGEEVEARRLSESQMIIDPEAHEALTEAGNEMKREVERELEWATAKKRIGLEKLRAAFLDDVIVERVRVRALKTPHSIVSFRTTQLAEHLQKSLREVHALIEQEARAMRSGSAHGGKTSEEDGKGEGDAAARSGVLSGGGEAKEGERVHGWQVRKEKRLARKAALAKLASERPGPDAEDPADVEAVREAAENMGDYKLKSDPHYKVPEDKRVDHTKKRRQMVLLEESVHSIKMDFNKRLLALRDLKKAIVENVAADNARLAVINEELGISEELWSPQLPADEWPENRVVVSESDVAAERERQGLPPLAPGAAGAAGAGAAGASSGAAAAAGAGAAAAADAGVVAAPAAVAALKAGAAAGAVFAEQSVGAGSSIMLAGDLKSLPLVVGAGCKTTGSPSEAEAVEDEARRRRLVLEKEALQKQQHETVSAFDEAVYELRRERLKLDADLKAASLRLVLLYRELQMLHEMARRDSALNAKLDKARNEKSAVMSALHECKEKLGEKKSEIEVWQEKDVLILNEFHSMVPETHAAHAALLKIFKRKIKRSRKRADDEGESDESDESDYDEDEDSEMEEDEEEDVCPPGCDQTLYDKVLELREKRLDQEDVLNDFQKALEDLRKTHDRHTQRQRQIDKELTATNNEITAFQADKQRRLNLFDTTISLTLSQIMCASNSLGRRPASPGGAEEEDDEDGEAAGDVPSAPIDGVLPSTISDCLVFSRRNLVKLNGQIGVLAERKRTLRTEFKDLHRQQKRLAKDKKGKEADIAAASAKCEDLQMLKFGQMVDIDSLDKATTSKNLEDLEATIAVKEGTNTTAVGRAKEEAAALKTEALRLTQENTALLSRIGELAAQQSRLEKELNKSGSVTLGDGGPAARKEAEERMRLLQLVKLQAKEMDALKAEISMLRRKGGHVYTPAVPPPSTGGGGMA